MKKTVTLFCIVILSVLSTTAFSQRLVGNWNIVAFQTIKVGEPGFTLSDIGVISFFKDGSGESNVDYSMMGVQKNEQIAFVWNIAQGLISIQGQESDFTRTWIMIEDKRNSQKWQSTDGRFTVYTLELKKQKKK